MSTTSDLMHDHAIIEDTARALWDCVARGDSARVHVLKARLLGLAELADIDMTPPRKQARRILASLLASETAQ